MQNLNKSFDDFMAEEGFSTGATQRIKLNDGTGRGPVPRQPQGRPAPRRKSVMSKKERATVITLFSVAGVLLIGIVIALVLMLGGSDDNGLILNNVYVAGVNIGGMTEAQAKKALEDAAKDYSELNMTVKVLDTTVSLTPAKTGARLDIDAVVKAAYDLGRAGSHSEQEKAQNATSHNLSVLPYLNLNTDYIESVVQDLGEKYSTLQSDPTIRVEGTEPPEVMESYDTSVVYQTMYIFMGTAEYDLSTKELYQQILAAYDSNIYDVVARCSVTPPNASVMDKLEAAFANYCKVPVDANIDENYNITPEVYGYGFVLETVKDQVTLAQYGETLEIPMTFIQPDITAQALAGDLFKDILGSVTLPVENDTNLITNLKLVCKAINGKLLKTGESFSFNELIGETTRQRGYKPYSQFVGKIYTENVYGGGISQAASALYYAVLQADVDVLERHSHSYAPTFIQAGLDADVLYGSKDLQFRNSTENPIRVVAEYKDGAITIQLLGTDTKDYTVEIVLKTDKVYDPVTLWQTMPEINAGNYKEGDILQTPIIGFDISVYKLCTYKPVEEDGEVGENDPTDPNTPSEPSDPTGPGEPGDGTEENPAEKNFFEILVGQSHYDKRNAVQINIYIPTTPPSEPSQPMV